MCLADRAARSRFLILSGPTLLLRPSWSQWRPPPGSSVQRYCTPVSGRSTRRHGHFVVSPCLYFLARAPTRNGRAPSSHRLEADHAAPVPRATPRLPQKAFWEALAAHIAHSLDLVLLSRTGPPLPGSCRVKIASELLACQAAVVILRITPQAAWRQWKVSCVRV